MNLLGRVRAILLAPRAAWQEIAREPGGAVRLLVHYVAILAAIPAVCWFIGRTIVGIKTSVGTLQLSLMSGLVAAIVRYLMSFVTVLVVAMAADALAPTFRGRRSFDGALKLVVYSFTPVWLGGFFLLVPGLSFLFILGIYGFYLLWLGLPVLMRAPTGQRSTISYFAVIALCALVLLYVTEHIVNTITGVSVWPL